MLLPCPECPEGFLHEDDWSDECAFALLDAMRLPGLTLPHCHSCGAVLPDDWQTSGEYRLRRENS